MKLPELPVRPWTILLGVVVVAVSFFVSLKAMDWLSPRAKLAAPQLAQLPPLPPAPRSSVVIAPVAISLTAIRQSAERAAPKNFAGKADNPVSQLLQDADIGWTATRGPILATGTQDVLSLTTPINGKLNVTGSLTSKATGAVGDAIGGLLGADAAKRIGSVNIKAINASAEIRGNVVITMRPRLAQTWHVEPNFGAQVILGDTSLVLAGARVNVPTQVKPVIDKTVGEQLNAVSERIRNDKTLERTAREQWAKACRSMPLQGAGATASLPPLWLELKPIRAVAAQPTVNATAVTVAVGIEAETRITPAETRPSCPFPDKISIVPPTAAGVGIGVPIDLPFTELDKILQSQLAGRTFPEDGSGSVDVTVKRANVAAAGDRLLISLLVHAKEKKSWFGFGADATVHIWGRPVLDQRNQTVRLNDMELAVESEAAFGLLGAAARAAVPHLQRALMEKATIDLKPFAANAQKKIAEAIAEFQKNDSGVRVDANINDVGLSEVAFDSRTLRVIVEAQGAMNVYVSKLPEL
jgi:Domain of unknown function (DUF4403)